MNMCISKAKITHPLSKYNENNSDKHKQYKLHSTKKINLVTSYKQH